MKDSNEYIDALKAALPPSVDFAQIYNLLPEEEWEKDPRGAALKAFIKADLFDASYYLEKYEDIREAGLDPLWHYLNFGIFEKRRIEPALGERRDESERQEASPPLESVFDQDSDDSISVLIPAYNVEPYLERAVTSILKQTHKNLEIIIYDDASTDGTRAVGERLANKYANVLLLQGEENYGESHGRNKCLAAARGVYSTFVDGDDYYIDNNFLKRLLEQARQERADVVVSPYRRYRKGKKPWTDECRAGRFSGKEAAQIYIDRDFGSHGCASKLYLTAIAKDIHVNEYGYSEDVPFVLEALLRARRVSVSVEPGYMYDLTSTSSWRPKAPTPLHFYSSLRALFEIICLCWESGLELKKYLEIWQSEHGKRVSDYITNPSNLLAASEVTGYFSSFRAILEQLVPELRQFFKLANKINEPESQILPLRYKKYVHALQGRMQRYLDSLPVREGKNYVIWAQHLKNGGLERVAAQLGNAIAEDAQVWYILDEEKEYDYDVSGLRQKADLLNPEMHRLLRDATAIFDFHWKTPGESFPILNYALSRYKHKYIATVHSSLQCDAYFDAVAQFLKDAGQTEGSLQGILCVSHGVQEALEKRYGPLSGVVVINNPLDLEECERAKALKTPYKYVLFAGRLNATRHKGIDLLLQAWRNSKAHNSGTRLMLVGSGNLEAGLREYILKEGMEEEIVRCGFQDEIYSYMKGALFTVMPSRWEGFGNVVIESLACGTPVVASSVGIATEVIKDNINGLLVEPDNYEALTASINLMLELEPKMRFGQCIKSVRDFDIRKYNQRLTTVIGRA